ARREHRQRRFLALADDEQVVARLSAEYSRGGILDRDRFAQPGAGARAGCGRIGPAWACQQIVQEMVAAEVGRDIAFEDDLRLGSAEAPFAREVCDFQKIFFTCFFRQPDDLEWTVALDHA